mgnify:CR=1 FL=1
MGKTASETLCRVRELFKSMDILNREIVLEFSGHRYKARCDETSFMVYRIHNNLGPRSHVPGWPVCLITHDTIFEECSSVELSGHSFDCGLTLDKWLEIIVTNFKQESSKSNPGKVATD